MPRPFPWLSRLSNIRRSVSNTQRSHYTRRDLELLFGVSARAAGRLLELVATEPIGTAHLVARERLGTFLEAVSEAEDVAALCESMRAERANLTRVKARYLYVRDEVQVPFASLPASIVLERGRLEIRFETVEELVAQLVVLGQAMADDPLAFERACETRRPEEVSREVLEGRWVRAEIVRMDEELRARAEGGGGRVPAKTPAGPEC